MKGQYIFFVFIIFIAILVIGCSRSSNIATGNAIRDTEEIRIPLSELSKDVRFYEYEDQGVNIRYFAVLGSDGKPRTAFDACDVCGGYKGYRQEGDDIVCNNCGRSFTIDGLGTKNKGYGCWPSYLPHTVDGDYIIIDISNIEEGRSRFA